eukprot:scaffold98654_cov40-Cyclotella_meneghiniana.AAC.1
MDTGVVLKEGVTFQVWPLLLSGSFALKSRDPKLRRHISPKNLMEYHSALTSYKDMLPYLHEFFESQEIFCDTYYYPLAVCMDCAKGLQTLFLMALCRKGEYEFHKFDSPATRPFFELARKLVPTFLISCGPHVVRSGRRWITSKDRPPAIRNQ